MDEHEHEWRDALRGRYLWHAAPLHYVPAILTASALYPKSRLSHEGIASRPTALRRDLMLGLDECVHFSFGAMTPLLQDKLTRGYPHVVFCFDSEAFADLPHALLPYNTKAWRSKACYEPVIDPWDKRKLLHAHDAFERYPSLEFLVFGNAPLNALRRIVFATDAERCQLAYLAEHLRLPLPAPLTTDTSLAPPEYRPSTGEEIAAYFAACRSARRVLPPPKIRFD